MLKSGCTLEQHFQDKGLTDMMSMAVHNANEQENGEGSFGNAFEVKTKIEKEEGSAIDSSLPSSKSDVQLVTQEAMVNRSLHNQGHKDNDVKLLENPLESLQDMKELEIVPSMESESMESNLNRTAFELESFDGVTTSEHSTMTDMSSIEISNDGENQDDHCLEGEKVEAFEGVTTSEHRTVTYTSSIDIFNDGEHQEDHCVDGEKDEAFEEGSQKVLKPMNDLKCLGLHFNGVTIPDKDEKHPASVDDVSEPFHDTEGFMAPPTVEEIHIEDQLDTEADKLEDAQRRTFAGDRDNSTIPDVDQSHNNSSGGSLDKSIAASETFMALVSTDIDGWQRFDVEEGNNVAYGDDISNPACRPLELWEQLLLDSLEKKEEVKETPSLDLGTIESSTQDGNWQIGLASPGNPFIEGLDRLSNFSETEGTALNENFQSPLFSDNIETATFPHGNQGSSDTANRDEDFRPLFSNNIERATFLHDNEESSDTANRNEKSWSGVLHNFVKPGEQQQPFVSVLGNSDASKVATQYESQLRTHTDYPSFAEATGFSLQSTELYEAPSFMSLVDPASHELFKACMPAYQTSSNVFGHENSGEKWEANFDLMVPSQSQISPLQEITRSISLPRIATSVVPAGTRQISTEVNNVSLKSLTPTASPKAKPAILLSPKLSPLVKKMVQKVRTTPAVASKVLSTASNMLSPNTVDNNVKQGSIWSRCMCCFNRNKN